MIANEELYSDVSRALKNVSGEIGVNVNEVLLEEYLWGAHPELLHFDSFREQKDNLKAIDRFLIAANAYLKWSDGYYNVFDPGRISRAVLLIIQFSDAVRELRNFQAENLDGVLKRASSCIAQHELESLMFEVIVAKSYIPVAEEIEFLKPIDSKTPDLRVVIDKTEFHVECKKQIRINNKNHEVRDKVRSKVFRVLGAICESGDSLLIELLLKGDPDLLESEMLAASIGHCRNNELSSFSCPLFDLNISELPPLKEDSGPYLHTSPSFLCDRYNYRESDNWMGFVQSGLMMPCNHIDTPKKLEVKLTTWTWDIKNDCGLKWKVVDPDTLYKIKRLSFSKTFEAINQLSNLGSNSIVHYWIESETGHGSKQGEFIEYLQKMLKSSDEFAYLIINETFFDVTPKNLVFDLIENGHFICGDHAKGKLPRIINVFSRGEVKASDSFGIGAKLDDIDP